MSAFEELGIDPLIIRAIEELDWVLPTPIQTEAIPLILGGGDVLAAAETGSGKTGAFALPILQITYETLNNKAEIPIVKDDQLEKSSSTGTDGSPTIEWDLTDRDKNTAVDGLVCQARSADWCGIKATKGISSGKYYYEAIVRDEGLCRVGWALKKSTRNIGTDKFSWGYGGTGKKSNESKFIDYGKPFGNNDTIGCYINFDDEIIGFTKNGLDFGEAFKFNSKAGIFYPALVLKNAEMVFNFGQSPMKHELKGYEPIIKANLLVDQTVVVQQPVAAEESSNKKGGGGGNKKGGGNNKKNNDITMKEADTNTTSNKPRKTLSLIIEPTRELADQTYSAILNFSKYLTQPTIQVSLCIGGEKSMGGRNKIEGDIIIGTPGRLESLVKDGSIDLSNIKFFVLDEADQLIDDNLSIVNFIYNKLPIGQGLQVLFFSATLHSNKVIKFSEQITKNPTWVDLKGRDFIPDLITHAYIKADPMKFESLWRNSENPLRMRTDGVHSSDVTQFGKLKEAEQKSEAIKLLKAQLLLKTIQSFKMDQAIIFARTRLDCDNIHSFLKEAGGSNTALEGEYSSTVLHGGDNVSRARKDNLEKFKNGDVRFLICTDVAARGIDVRGLPFMINYTLPESFEDYIHRVGRVGRADRIGLALSLVGFDQEKVWYHTCRDKGKGCHNIKLTDNGGCCIWYDEPTLFQTIQEALGPIELDDQTFALPADMKPLNFGGSSKQVNGINLDYKPHTEELKSRVLQLSQLEETIQIDYLTLPNRINLK